jgi:uncharacterized delta-60 repeat protein
MPSLFTSFYWKHPRHLMLGLLFCLLSLGSMAQPGTLDVTFGNFVSGIKPSTSFSDVLVLPSGKILLAGAFPKGIVRLNSDGTPDFTFNPGGTGVNSGSISQMVLQGDQKVLLVASGNSGSPFSYNGTTFPGIARINSDGTLDTSFNPPNNPDDPNQSLGIGAKRAVALQQIQNEQKIVVFEEGLSTSQPSSVIRLNANGTLDINFNKVKVITAYTFSDGYAPICTISIQGDSKIILSGYNADTVRIGNASPILVKGVFRLNANGTYDSSFLTPTTGISSNKIASNNSYTALIQPDGKVILPLSSNSTTQPLIRFNPANGTVDNNFSTAFGGDSRSTTDMLLLPDGDIIAIGSFTSYSNQTRNGIVRINPDGTLDTDFNPGTGFPTSSDIKSIARQADGKYLVAGSFASYNGTPRLNLVRINADGSIDNTFANFTYGFDQSVSSVLVQPDGKVLVGGPYFSIYNGVTRNKIARLNADGTNDATFNTGTSPGFDFNVNALLRQADGKIWVGGGFTKFNDANSRKGLVRLTADGAWDNLSGVGVGDGGTVNSLALRSDGKLFVGGSFTSYNGANVQPLILIEPSDGTRNTSFNLFQSLQAGGSVNAIAVQSDNKVIFGGSNLTVDPNYGSIPNIFRANADGKLDNTFNVGTGFNADVYAIVVLPSNDVLVGGNFTRYKANPDVEGSGSPRNGLALLSSTGDLKTGFTQGISEGSTIYSIRVQADGGILVGGSDGTSTGILLRFKADGTLDTDFNKGNAGPNKAVNSIDVQSPDGKILIGGEFESYNGTPRDYIARVNNAAACGTITLSPASLSNATAGSAFSVTITAAGGTAPYTYAVSAGTLPAGLTLTNAGTLSGTPTTAGTFTFTIKATASGSGNCTGTKAYTLTVAAACPTIAINSATLPAATQGTAYSQTLTVTGGATVFTVSSGSLPDGLTLSSAGVISGTPTASSATASFTVQAAAGTCVGTRNYTITVTGGSCPTVNFTPATLPNANVGTAYSQTIVATDGTLTYTLALAEGDSLPAGLAFEATTGLISGTPTTADSSTFTIKATAASGGCTGTKEYTLTVLACPTIAISPDTLPAATQGIDYSQTLRATGGTAPYRFAITDGTLPAGVSLDSTGVLSGSSSVAGAVAFTVAVKDSNGCVGGQAYTVCVNPKPRISPSNQNSFASVTLVSDSPEGNQWLLNEQPISGATGASYTVTEKGSYQVEVSINGCTGRSDALTITASEPGQSDAFMLYPNPVEDQLVVRYRSANPVQFVAVNMPGIEVGRITPVRNSEGIWEGKLRTSSYPSGTYLLRIEEAGSGIRQANPFIKR